MSTEKQMLIDVLDDVQQELKRFQSKLIEYRDRANGDRWKGVGTKEAGAFKRAALDLKNELTKITQSRQY